MFIFAGWISWQLYANDFLRTLKVLLPVETDATSRCIKFQNSNIVNFYSMLSEYYQSTISLHIYRKLRMTMIHVIFHRVIAFHFVSSVFRCYLIRIYFGRYVYKETRRRIERYEENR